MADFLLTLGGVAFQDFEVPPNISGGGQQALSIHKYAGGVRTIDAFGPDDDDLSWQGVFLDAGAEARCQQLDTMRRQGQPILLNWSSFSYRVVIRAFKFDFERFYQIRYSITLAVVEDLTQPATAVLGDLEAAIQSDLSDAFGFVTVINDAGLSAAIGAIQSTVTQVNSITGGSVPFLNTLTGQVNTAKGINDGLLAAADGNLAGIGQAASFASGTGGANMAANLSAVAAAAQSLPVIAAMGNTLGRLSKNIAQVTQ